MKPTAQTIYRDRLFSRSLLESSPRAFAPKRPAFYPAHPAGGQTSSQFHQFKRKLLQDALAETNEPGLFKPICGAANQAAAQAWETSCPLLVFPCLFAEMVHHAATQISAAARGTATRLCHLASPSAPRSQQRL